MKNFLLSLTLFVLVTSILAFIALGCSRDPGTEAPTSPDVDAGFHPPPPITPTVVPINATALPTASPAPTATSIAAVLVAQAQPTFIDADAVTIAYRDDDGFFPKRIDIEPGTTVIFRNDSTEPIWPASNIHPTHAILPEFDANRDIRPGASYAFTFDERGFWRFHNHNNPEEGGLIVVLGGGGGPPPQPMVMTIPDTEFEIPGNVPFDDYVGLFSSDLLMTQYVVRFGPQNTVHLLKEAEGLISVDCHQRAHTLGRLAFEEYGAAAFALSGHECQAGSFHGATEALFAERGTANLEADVAAICSAAENPFFRHQCVHGVGHGLMAWTTYEINDALPFCDRMSTEADKGSCYSGVFMENVVGGLTGVMGHTTEYLRDDDPHFPCDAVDSKYVNDCYFYQTSHMLVVFGYDYSKVADACGEAPEYAQLNCYASYGRDVGAATRKNPALAIQYCDYVPVGDYRTVCIQGAAQDRFWEESGADDALAICAIVDDSQARNGCYKTIIDRARNVFRDEQQFADFCARIDERDRRPCDLTANVP